MVRGSASTEREDTLGWTPGSEVESLEGIDAVVHLAGASVADRWTEAHKERIRKSRVDGTDVIARAVVRDGVPRLVSASAVGFYGDRGDERIDEDASRGEGFLADVCGLWEGATEPARDRTTIARIGIVFAADGGALPKMATPFRFGVGGKVGSGRQFLSWVHLQDLVAMLLFAIDGEVTGTFNAVSPNPVRQSELAAVLAKVLRRPNWLPVPKAMIKLAMGGDMAEEMLLASQRIEPAVLRAAGFEWRHGSLEPALQDVLG